ncbi:hypothetical protein NIES3974_06020 [Calothrix sp. NIES-3974]|nr:hypothetical protein NIES3974_06020 [Calothrix sp. NIES-3974]
MHQFIHLHPIELLNQHHRSLYLDLKSPIQIFNNRKNFNQRNQAQPQTYGDS